MLSLHAQTLARAVPIVEGEENLAFILGVSPQLLELYLRGEAVVPGDLFFRATEILTTEGIVDAGKSGSDSAPVKE
jgi:hypothetical protein